MRKIKIPSHFQNVRTDRGGSGENGTVLVVEVLDVLLVVLTKCLEIRILIFNTDINKIHKQI